MEVIMKKVKYNDGYICIDDTPVDEKETGVLIPTKEELDKTTEIQPISKDILLENTLTDLWGDSNE